jgi:membrane protease YdiL (CAAX protease family)
MSAGRATASVAVVTVAFAAALASHRWSGFWLATTAAGALAAALASWTAGARLRALLRPRTKSVLIGVGSGGLLAAATHLGFTLVAQQYPPLAGAVATLYGTLAAYPGQLAAVPLVAFVAFAEELVWRGLLVDLLGGRVGRGTLVAVATLAYALPLVAAGNPALVVAGLGCGLVWTMLRLGSGDLLTPVLSHLTWNALLLGLWRLVPPTG